MRVSVGCVKLAKVGCEVWERMVANAGAPECGFNVHLSNGPNLTSQYMVGKRGGFLVDVPPGGARNLSLDPKGYWVAARSETLSYPSDGNDACFSLEDNSFWFRHRNDVIAAAVQQFPPSGPIFDIGGGNGYVAAGLERAGFATVVVEPGQTGAENALRRGLQNVVCATVDAADFTVGAIDAVGLFDVLEHIEDDLAFLVSLRRLLRPCGRVYVSVPAFQFLWSSEDEIAGHYRRYTRRSLGELFLAADMEVEFLTYFFWFLPIPIWLLRAIPSRLGWRRASSLQTATREHTANQGVRGRLVGWALSREITRMHRRRAIRFGGSCLAVARNR